MSRRRALGLAVLLAIGLFAAGRLVTPTRWYAAQPNYRAQVDAFLSGRLALTEAPEGALHDLSWTDRGVQQVWGLGVPMWQTPFEVVGRAIGLTPFPDRIPLFCWLVLVMYASLRAWWRVDQPWWRGAASMFVTALLPGFVTLVRGRMGVYEEAATYAYGAAMLLLAGTERLRQSPSRARYLSLVAAAGLTGLLRPTVWFYGLATLIVASVVRRPRLAELALGVTLFVAGGAALYATNVERNGSPLEFGQRLNLEPLPGNLYATRFSYPFQRVGLIEASKELVGGLFGQPERHWKRTFYDRDLHVWQSDVPRWREYYFTTFSWPYLPLLLAGLVLGVVAWRRRDGPERWLVAWAVLGGAPLAAFYLRTPSIASRYLLDLAPAFAALLLIVWWAVARRPLAFAVLAAAWLANVVLAHVAMPRVAPVGRDAAATSAYAISRAIAHDHPLPDAYDLDDPWLPTNTDVLPSFDRCIDDADNPIDPAGVPITGDRCIHGERDKQQWIVWASEVREEPAQACPVAEPVCAIEATPVNSGEIVGAAVPPPSLYLNGMHWDLATGSVPPATYFWTRDPRFVEIDARGPEGTDWSTAIQVAVGARHLRLVSLADTAHGVRLRFEPAAPLPGGLQIVFVAIGPDSAIDQPVTPFAITKIRWR